MNKKIYFLKNIPALLRGIFGKRKVKLPDGNYLIFSSTLSAVYIPKAGKAVDLGIISRRVVTNAGVDFMASDFVDGTTDITNFNWHASGTGTNPESVNDTALQTEVESRVSGTKSKPSAGQYRTVATITYGSSYAITEHGIFSASTGGTLWDRSVFSAINVSSGDSIQFTYTLTINAGG
ncbi:MAG: hypothetical protein QXH95_03435 [Thermoplasmata archaeon]